MNMNDETNNIVVAIRCAVYNHELYLRDCLEGFVTQKTSFRFVAVVHDDCSTDNSTAIIREYEQKYPNIIKPIYETQNQWSKHDGSVDRIIRDAVVETRPKYIALCEGDDYWTDPYKLQKQVDFMETHPDYSMCFHRTEVLSDNKTDPELYSHLEEREYSACEIYKNWSVPTCSVMYRANALTSEESNKSIVYGDIYLFLRLAEKGKLYNLNFCGAVYRRNSGGISQIENVSLYKRLYQQYMYMEKRFPQADLAQISRDAQDTYLRCLIASEYFPDRWKYRFRYMLRHPKLLFSTFALVTIKQIFCKPTHQNA